MTGRRSTASGPSPFRSWRIGGSGHALSPTSHRREPVVPGGAAPACPPCTAGGDLPPCAMPWRRAPGRAGGRARPAGRVDGPQGLPWDDAAPSSRTDAAAAGWGRGAGRARPGRPPPRPRSRPQRRPGARPRRPDRRRPAGPGCAGSTTTRGPRVSRRPRPTGSSAASPGSTAPPSRSSAPRGPATPRSTPSPRPAGRRGRHGPGVACGDVGAPAGGPAILRRAAPAPVRRLPGADLRRPRPGRLARRPARLHDGLLRHPARRRRPGARAARLGWARLLRRLLWRRGPPPPSPSCAAAAGAGARRRRQSAGQPGPYCAIDAGPLRLVLDRHRHPGSIDARRRPTGCARVSAATAAEDPAHRQADLRRTAQHAPRARSRASGDRRRVVTRPRAQLRRRDRRRHPQLPALPRAAARRPHDAVRGRRRRRRVHARHAPDPERRPLGPASPRTTSAATRCAATRWPGSAARHRGILGLGRSRSRPTTPRRSWPSASASRPPGRRPRPPTSPRVPGGPPDRSTRCRPPGGRCRRTRRRRCVEPRRPPLFRSLLRIDATAEEIVLSCFAATGAARRRAGAGGPASERGGRAMCGAGPTIVDRASSAARARPGTLRACPTTRSWRTGCARSWPARQACPRSGCSAGWRS